MTIDPVVSLVSEETDDIVLKEKIATNKRLTVICPASLYLTSDRMLTIDQHVKIVDILASTADYIVSELNSDIILMPMQISIRRDDDRPIVRDIFNAMKYQSKGCIFYDEGVQKKLEVIRNADLVIGMRLHSLIFLLLHMSP